jgi:hypothetical protein
MTHLSDAEKQERASLALDATYEIEAVVTMVKRALPSNSDCLGIACLVRRIEDLNSVVMSVYGGDDDRSTEKLRAVVHIR